MIQRIQSVYLLLAAAAAVLFNFIPLGIDEKSTGDIVIFGKDLLPLLIVSLISGGLALMTVFVYKNRTLQSRLCRLNLFVTSSLIGLTVFFLFGNPNGAVEMPGVGLAMLVFMFIFNLLAMKKINDDDKLIKSMDRLR